MEVWYIVQFVGGAIKWVLNSEISRDLLNRLENTTCGEELFFQTVLLNSPFSENIINNNLRIMVSSHFRPSCVR